MAKPTSPRAERILNWEALLRAIRDEETAVTPESRALWLQGKGPDPAPGWNEDYLHALQQALEQRNPDQLLKMLDASVPMSALLLPVVAEVIRDLRNGLHTGRPTLVTPMQDRTIRHVYEKAKRAWGMSQQEAIAWLANPGENNDPPTPGVSIDTIKRSLKRTKPTPRTR